MNPILSAGLNLLFSLLGLGFIGWLAWRGLKRSVDPAKIIFKVVLSFLMIAGEFFFLRHMDGSAVVFMVGSVVLCCFPLGLMWTPQISAFIFSPLTNLFDGGDEPPVPKPLYSIAIAKQKSNRPLEAIVAIREQLALFPGDLEGVMLLANVQAEDMNDLAGAENTLLHFCSLPQAADRQIVGCLIQIADWHLKKGADVDSARSALQKIVERFPGTEFALRAEQRLAHLVETENIILAQHDRQSVAVPEGVKNIGLLESTEFLRPKEIEPGKLAAAYVQHLNAHPNDAEVREKLAAIYAHDFKRLDLATLELEQLINESRYTPKQITHWLNSLANYQVELGADAVAVMATLEKIIERFPDSPQAEIVQRRLERVKLEIKSLKETPSVKMGVYEQNIGLKYGAPRNR